MTPSAQSELLLFGGESLPLSPAAKVFVDPIFQMESRDPQARRLGERTGHRWSHCWCNPGDEEDLHEIARKIGMRREWFQAKPGFPHYDLTPSRRADALKHGAVERSLVDWLRERRSSASNKALNSMQTTPDHVTHIEPNEIFVFGSNMAGRHGKGAALTARILFGAKNGVGVGPTGRCYALPTKDGDLRVLPFATIARHVTDFLAHAATHPEQRFLVTPVGCGLAGFSPAEIAPLFFAAPLPANVSLPASFLPFASNGGTR